jgi:hypothetical protein
LLYQAIKNYVSKYVNLYYGRLQINYIIENQNNNHVFVGSVLLIKYIFCAILLCVFKFWVPCCDVCYDFGMQTMFGSSLPPAVCRSAFDFILHYLCLFAHSGVQHILCYDFVLLVFVLCLVYTMLLVSLDCQFLIAPSVLSNVYFSFTNYNNCQT